MNSPPSRSRSGTETSPSQPNQPQTSKSTPFLFLLTSIPILIFAVSLGLTNTNVYKTLHLKTLLSSNPIHKLLNPNQNSNFLPPSYCVLWMAPFLSGGGYSSEAWSYISSIHQKIRNPKFKLAIRQHGDLESFEFWEGLPLHAKELAIRLHQTECEMNRTIVVCHSEPGAWYPPLFETLPCPIHGYGHHLAVIGRTMFESDRVNVEHASRCNRMDYVWVPTDFHVTTFVNSGVDVSKVIKIVQPVDVEFFSPINYEPLDLSVLGNLVLGEKGEKTRNSGLKKEFAFLSIFKWEYRKGWDVLLKAYLNEFSKLDGVSLYLLTNPYHSDRDFGNKIIEFVEKEADIEKPSSWAPIYVIDTHIAQMDLPKLYKAVDAFVLPSRGEGWGRPLVEAMAMALPVITTNWSGPTEYLSDENGYLLPLERMSEVVEGPFKGHSWAEPSIHELRRLLRHVMLNPEEGRAKGTKAREDMIRLYSPEIVAGIVNDQIGSIIEKSMS